MKVLIVGSIKDYAIESYYIKYLKEWGVEIYYFASSDQVSRFRTLNIWTRIIFRTGIYRGYAPVNQELIKMADDLKPDIIWIFKGMEIFPYTLSQLKKKNFKLTNYNPDHPFILSSRGSGNRNVTRSVGLYDLHFCYHNGLRKRIANEFNLPAFYLPFAFDLSSESYEMAVSHTELKKICFIGNPDPIRARIILQLLKSGLEVDVYGHGWNTTRLARQMNIRIHDAVYGQEFWNKLRQYRVQLNIFRKHNQGSHNMRTFEVPAVGGIQLAPFSEEQAVFFEEDNEIFFYRDIGELQVKCRYLIDLPAREANAIRKAARRRSTTSGYTYRDRSLLVYNAFKTVFG